MQADALAESSLRARRLKVRYKALVKQQTGLIKQVEHDQQALQADLPRRILQGCELKGLSPEGLFRAADSRYRQSVTIAEFREFLRTGKFAVGEDQMANVFTELDVKLTGSVGYQQWLFYATRHGIAKEHSSLHPADQRLTVDNLSGREDLDNGKGGKQGPVGNAGGEGQAKRQPAQGPSLQFMADYIASLVGQENSDKLDYEAFKKLMLKAFPSMSARDFRQAFKKLDPLNSGYVFVPDVEQLIKQLKAKEQPRDKPRGKAEQRQQSKQADKRDSLLHRTVGSLFASKDVAYKEVTLAEFTAHAKTKEDGKRMLQLFKHHDRNLNGSLDAVEAARLFL